MSEEIIEIVRAFKNDNGNKNFTCKELVIFFNKQHEKDIKELKEIVKEFPCWKHNTRITKIETTNRLIAGAVGVILTIFGLIITFVK